MVQKTYLGFWGEKIQDLQTKDFTAYIWATGKGECPLSLIQKGTVENTETMIPVNVGFDISKETGKKNGKYLIYYPNDDQVPEEFSDRTTPILFECQYKEDKLIKTPVYYDKNGLQHPVSIENGFMITNMTKMVKQKGR